MLKDVCTPNAVEYNYGLAAFKCILAFCIVFLHFGCGEHPHAPSWSVPAFMIVSFYLMKSLWQKPSWHTLSARLARLACPFFIWGIFYWIANGLFTGEFSLRALFWQLVVGHTVCMPLYFLFLLMLFTELLFTVFKAIKQASVRRALFLSLATLCCIIQYSGVNATLCTMLGERIPEMLYPIGRIAELLPAALIGLILSNGKVRALSAAHERLTGFSGCLIASLGIILSNTTPIPKGFLYQGIPILLEASGTTLIFLSCNKLLLKIPTTCHYLQMLSSVMLGVYCLHWLIGFFMLKICGLSSGIRLTFVVYAVATVCSIALSKFSLARKVVC